MQIRNLFQQKYPNVQIVGSNYEPSAQKKTMTKMIGMATWSTIGLTMGGDQLFEMLGSPPPAEGSPIGDLYKTMRENKFYTCAGSYFIGNTVSENILSTGAFEIYYDGKLVYSKLETGRLPRINEIMDDMEVAMRGDAAIASEKIATPTYQY